MKVPSIKAAVLCVAALYCGTIAKAETTERSDVVNAATSDLQVIARHPEEIWAVITTAPTLPGGFIVEQRAYVDHTKREVVIIPGTNSKPMVKGQFKILQALTQAPQVTQGQYRWEAEEAFFRPTVNSRKDALFVSGTPLVCRINSNKQGRDHFDPVYPIPARWQTLVKPAFTFTKDNLKVFNAADIAANEPRLRQLLNDSNPFTAIAACRTLTQAGKLDAEFVKGSLAKVRGLRQAVFAYFVVNGATNKGGALERNAQLVPQVDALVKQQSVSGLKNLALGAYAAGVSTAYDPFEPKKRIPLPGFGPALLRAISQRTRQLKITKPHSQDERDLLSLLQNVGLR